MIILGIIMSYWLAIIVLVHIGHKTLEEAKKVMSEKAQKLYAFLEELAKKQEQTIEYNIYIGSNGYSIVDEVINRYFVSLGRYYQIWYFEYVYQPSQNIITYQFKVYEQINDNFPHDRMVSICRRIGEKALAQHFHENNLLNMRVDNFIAVTIQADTLRYHIAKNNVGIEEIAKLRRQTH